MAQSKVDGPRSLTGRSAKVEGPEIRKQTVLRDQTGWSLYIKVDRPMG